MATTLQVTSQTSLRDLQAFLEQAPDNAKIRAKTDGEGNVTLYASTKKHGMFNWLTSLFGPGRQDKREAGERAIGTIIRQSTNLTQETKDSLVRDILGEAPRTDKGRELRTEGVRRIVERTNEELDSRIHLDGKDYDKGNQIGEGGMGVVHLYTSKDGDQVVVKRAQPMPNRRDDPGAQEEVNEDLRKEITVHEHISKSGDHPNVLPILGRLTGTKGEPMLVMPLAPRGDGAKLGDKLCGEFGGGRITKEQHRQMAGTMLKDVVGSLQHLHGKAGVLHLDMKLENYLMDDQGRLRLSDFGTSHIGLTHQFDRYPVETSVNLPPEVSGAIGRKTVGDPEIDKRIRQLDNELRSGREELRNLKQGPVDEAKQRQIDARQQELDGKQGERNRLFAQNKAVKQEMTIPVDTRTDSWVVGLMAWKLLVDPRPEGNPFRGDGVVTSQRIESFGRGDRLLLDMAREWYQDNPEVLARIDSLSEGEQALINGLLHPKPGQRMSLDEAMKSELLSGAGGDEVRRQMLDLSRK